MVNPYQSPEGPPAGAGPRLPALRSGVRATLVAHGLLFRTLVIDAPIEATLTFSGRSLHDTVTIDQHVVARKTSWWRITPRLCFTLWAGDERVSGSVEIRVWPWLALRGFRVTIAGQVVYREGTL